MEYNSIESFKSASGSDFGKGPFALLIAEDRVALRDTLDHLHSLGFTGIFIAAPDGMEIPTPTLDMPITTRVIRCASRRPGVATELMNALIEKVPGAWLHYCYNSEFLFFPFCEDRSVAELVAWVIEERRTAILTYVIDLYAGDLTAFPDAVDLDSALLDSAGYYAETRRANGLDGDPMERQLDFYGGLRWRFEEHVSEPKRKIDRVALFQAKKGLRLRDDHTLNDEEMNTFACPWHHSLTAAICSFRVAKALRTNPGSRHDIPDFRWHKSEPFQWSSMQLMELGLMEPGQWF